MATVDAAWLHMDSPNNRMVITGVLRLGAPVSLQTLSDLVSERMVARYPRFRQCITHGALGEARWAADESFDLRAHLHRVGVPEPGGRVGLEALVGQLLSSPLDPERPRWHVTLVEGVDGGCALVARIHHCLADGLSLARVLLSLTDGEEPEDHDHHSLIGEVLRHPAAAGERLLDRGRWALTHPGELVEATGAQLVGVARLGGGSAAVARRLLTLSADPPTALRGPLGPVKVAAWSDGTPLQRVKDIGARLGGTINDVLLTALASSLSRYLRSRGDTATMIRTLVPVNLRPPDRPIPRELGNHFGLVFLELPVDHLPPRQRFDEVRRRMVALKNSPEPAVTHAILSAAGMSPPQVEKIVVDVFGAKASLITTNVPGPRSRLTLSDVPVEDVLFWVPQSGAVSLGVSLFSYAGRVTWGVSADAALVPDPERIVSGFSDALDVLESVDA